MKVTLKVIVLMPAQATIVTLKNHQMINLSPILKLIAKIQDIKYILIWTCFWI